MEERRRPVGLQSRQSYAGNRPRPSGGLSSETLSWAPVMVAKLGAVWGWARSLHETRDCAWI